MTTAAIVREGFRATSRALVEGAPFVQAAAGSRKAGMNRTGPGGVNTCGMPVSSGWLAKTCTEGLEPVGEGCLPRHVMVSGEDLLPLMLGVAVILFALTSLFRRGHG
jgi:hypothetical protein